MEFFINNILKSNTPMNSKYFCWPVKEKISNGISFIGGMNIIAKFGSPVFSSSSGKIIYIGYHIFPYGNFILIEHFDNYITAYGHLDKICVKVGENVEAKKTIGTLGCSGFTKNPQLYFSIRKGNYIINI